MSGSSRLQKGEKIIKSVVDKQNNNSENKENIDAKVVFQDTKKSLEDLKKTIFSQEDGQKRKDQEKYLLQYVDRLIGFSILSVNDKNLLTNIKQNISKEISLQESDFETIIDIVSSLETKAETLNAVDKEKVKELNDTLSQHKKSLDLLKQGVAAINPSIEEAKKKAFETIKKDLEKNRWSSWLAGPVYEYLVDKHINKKSVSKFKDWLIGTVGLTVIGWFVGKDVKNLIDNIDNLSVEGILESPIVSKVESKVEEYTEEKIELAKNRFKIMLKGFIKKNTGKDVTEEQLNRVMEKLNVGEAFKDSTSEMKGVFDYLVKNDISAGDSNVAMAGLELVSFPFSFSAKIFGVLKDEGIIGYEDIGMNIVNGVVEYGLKGFQLFGTGLGWMMGRIPLDQISDKMASIYEKNEDTANYLLFALMYRSTNGILFKAISNTTAYIAKMALWPLVESGDDINSLKVIQDGCKANIDETMKHLRKIQKVLPPAGADLIGQYAKGFEDAISALDKANNVNKVLASLKDGPNLVNDLKIAYKAAHGVDLPDDIWKKMIDSKGNVILTKKSDIFRRAISPNIKKVTSGLNLAINDKSIFDKAKIFFGKQPVASLQKMNVMEDAAKSLDDVAKSFGNVVSNEGSILRKGLLGGMRSRVNMVKAGLNISESADRMVFAFDSIDDMSKFIDYTKSIAKTTPEALKFLIGKSPIFLISGMAMAGDGTIPEKMKELGKGLLGLVPIIGPAILIGDSMKVSDIDWTQAGIGSALLVTDAIYGIKAVNKIGFGRAVLRGISKPIIDVAEILKAGYNTGATIVKLAKGAATVMKAEGLIGFSKSFFAEILTMRRVAKLGVVAALVYGGYCGIDYLMDNIEDKEVQDMLTKYKDNQKGLNDYLQKQWPSYDKETKESILAYSIGAQIGISPEKIGEVEVKYNKDESKYTAKLPTVYGRDYLLPLKQNLENTLNIVEKGSSIDFSITGSAQVDYENTLKEQGYKEDEIKKQYSELGYSMS